MEFSSFSRRGLGWAVINELGETDLTTERAESKFADGERRRKLLGKGFIVKENSGTRCSSNGHRLRFVWLAVMVGRIILTTTKSCGCPPYSQYLSD